MESGSLDLMEMWAQMGFVAKAVAFVLFFMSMWSIGVAVERHHHVRGPQPYVIMGKGNVYSAGLTLTASFGRSAK
jgi:hypothetical protein